MSGWDEHCRKQASFSYTDAAMRGSLRLMRRGMGDLLAYRERRKLTDCREPIPEAREWLRGPPVPLP